MRYASLRLWNGEEWRWYIIITQDILIPKKLYSLEN